MDGIYGISGTFVVENPGYPPQVIEACPVRNIYYPVLYEAGIRHQHRYCSALIKRQELKAPVCSLAHLGSQQQGDIVCYLGDYSRCLLENLIYPLDLCLVPAVNQLLVFIAESHFLRRQQIVNIEAVTLRGRNSTGRSMNVFEVAQHFQIGHLFADGSRTNTKIILAGNGARAYRLSRGNVVCDYRA